jgi:hypothetical protein
MPATTTGNAATTISSGEISTYQAGARSSRLRQFARSDLTNKVASTASYTLRTSCRSAVQPRKLNRLSQEGLRLRRVSPPMCQRTSMIR